MEGVGDTGGGFAGRDMGTTNVPGGGMGMDGDGAAAAPPMYGAGSRSMFGSGMGYGGAGYGGAGYGGAGYGGGYGGMYGRPSYSGYGSSVYGGGMYGGASGMYGSSMHGMGGMPYSSPLGGLAQGVMAPGGQVINGMHSVMHSFARVSGLLEEVLRNFHMIFESVFGLIYSLGAFREEFRNMFGFELPLDKLSIVPLIKRVLKRALKLWRLFTLFILSPLAGRFSPVQILLRLLGLAPASASPSGTSPPSTSENERARQDRTPGSAAPANGESLGDEFDFEKDGDGSGSSGSASGAQDSSNL